MTGRSGADLAEARRRTTEIQLRAADPRRSAWVAANAGTGKTHVLTERVLRILLSGIPPDRILCLTYTKAAAAEMSTRVFERLSEWITQDDGDLARSLEKLLGRPPSDGERTLARTLFARAIETPGGLKVQTIHAFCERLLQRFPLEAGVPPSFEVLDDETNAAIRREATDEVLAVATRDPQGPLGKALLTAIAYAAEDGFDEKLGEAITQRSWLEAVQRMGGADGNGADHFRALEAGLGRQFQIRQGATRDAIEAEIAGLLSDDTLRFLKGALSEGSKNDQKMAECIEAVLAARGDRSRSRAFRDMLMTQAGEPKADRSLVTKAVQQQYTNVLPTLQDARDRLAGLSSEMCALDLVSATLALTRLADAVLDRVTRAKQRRAGLDFQDLVVHTARLLSTSGAAQWVLYKLDGGLDHILVDESQDTSPEQWAIVAALANEFFAGAGQAELIRTVFAVGDEKQSIYSFQGAAPEQFAAMGTTFEGMAQRAGLAFDRLPLTLSFRTVAPVLRAVDDVFRDHARTPGVTRADAAVGHIANRDGQAGLVEVWPTERWEEAPESHPWSPLEEQGVATPAARLAERIADTIGGWLKNGEWLASQGRPVRAGDILILVRKRRPFAPQMVSALKTRGIAVAGADRIQTTEHIAVEDLIALGQFLVLTEDDLSLAAVLKSPLIGLDDDDLMQLAPQRKGTLWSALLAGAEGSARWRDAADKLKRWRRRADLAPPFELFSELLDRDGGRARLLARLGPEASDPLDEFLNLALTYDEQEPPSLVGFLDWLGRGAREIKRDMEHGRDEVRVMTVHGAKGLEAPIVFLPDTCSPPEGQRRGLLALEGVTLDWATTPPLVWCVKGTKDLAHVKAARAAEAERARAEHQRLLYVAMTRARDRLYIAGFEGKKGPARGSWYELVTEGLSGVLADAPTPGGADVGRLECSQTGEVEKPRKTMADADHAVPLPAWAARGAPAEPNLAVPLAPSRLAPYDVDQEGDPAETPAAAHRDRADREPADPSPLAAGVDNRFLRGTITHALLEHLPAFDPADWPRAAKAFVDLRGATLSPRQRASIVTETLAVLSASDLAALFGPRSRAEVPIAARIPSPDGRHPPLVITGQIDRIADLGDRVLIVDYKTNRPPPSEAGAVAEAYLYQLTAYRLAVQQIFPNKPVRAAILWTDGPRIMEIPAPMLDQHQSRLWELHPSSLDAAMLDT